MGYDFMPLQVKKQISINCGRVLSFIPVTSLSVYHYQHKMASDSFNNTKEHFLWQSDSVLQYRRSIPLLRVLVESD
jgi:hypothetical protein